MANVVLNIPYIYIYMDSRPGLMKANGNIILISNHCRKFIDNSCNWVTIDRPGMSLLRSVRKHISLAGKKMSWGNIPLNPSPQKMSIQTNQSNIQACTVMSFGWVFLSIFLLFDFWHCKSTAATYQPQNPIKPRKTPKPQIDSSETPATTAPWWFQHPIVANSYPHVVASPSGFN